MSKSMTFEEACQHRNAHFVLKPFGILNADGTVNKTKALAQSDENKELFALCISRWDESHKEGGEVVAKLWQLSVPLGLIAGGPNGDKKFKKDRKDKLMHPSAKVELMHFLRTNADYATNGRYYEFLEAETDEYLEALEADKEARYNAAEEERLAINALKSGVASLARSAKAPKVPDEKPKKVWTVDIEGNIEEYKGKSKDFNEKDYLFTGDTKKACEAYLKENPVE